ncbi:phospholipase D-like domain-containing protein [Mesorhizobium sp. YC-39]|uniref:Phospholipase D n=1 Tax=Mesorhizobium robiniae TaxID=559315 RepID=A0ABV2GZ49_9HYPH|nr:MULTISPECIES: phospholipase D-like domain-containing protein [unclassified Mesorhizobium]MCV3211395.1 phospholipase D-like domain-containing protein [Mesorhizobium sp. YC-2]MCV3233120.1 phospholipase D-like domain-containing protein [Mesorhizobium sp. YC-39]MCV3243601.1 phospholipase D-like domain-containing protein [Mesorhizobium sp. ZC-5]
MPTYVLKTRIPTLATAQAVGTQPTIAIAVPEMVGRSCHLEGYQARDVPAFDLSEQIIAYASPDSTFAVTKRLIDAAKESILVGIYDFTASYMEDLLLAAMARKVKVSLMLDIDSRTESDIFDRLVQMGARGVSAPSCANPTVHVFSSSHEKVIVIDNEWVLVQSGNYSVNSIPMNVEDGASGGVFRPGNRDTGLAIRSRELSGFFAGILEADMALVDAVPEMLRRPVEDEFFLVERAPARKPEQLFTSETFDLDAPLTIQPVLSPDNYMDVVPGLIAKARKSVLIEQQYIRSSQPLVARLLAAIAEARNAAPELDVRIVLGKLFSKSDVAKEKKNLENLAANYGLNIAENIRYINTDEFVHCHNKMVIVDGDSILISSQNWSDAAVSRNREAGVWLTHPGIAAYFTKIFENDWASAFQTLPEVDAPEVMTPEALGAGGYIRVDRGDYEEV